jgi:hypothetical protein
MGSSRYDGRQRSSIILDAGYVSFTSIDKCQSSKTLGLYGNKLICIVITIIILFCISFINLSVSLFDLFSNKMNHSRILFLLLGDFLFPELYMYLNQSVVNNTVNSKQRRDMY